MSNIILQHFNGKLRPLDIASIANIKAYASRIGVDYELIKGRPFREHLTDPCQKVFMLDEKWDEYNDVLMLDIDMFVPYGNHIPDVFSVNGCGLYNPIQQRLHQRLIQWGRGRANAPYWGGAIYKFNRERRIALRSGLGGDERWMDNFNQPYHYEDEGIMHHLAIKGGLVFSANDIMDPRWCYDNYLPDPATAFMIHMRTKIKPEGPKRTKIENYNELVERGIL
tara:strand:+ start:37 stop:708 length:672 start_codon:yes stop_codon:yes gene_type:complete